jgi:thiamine-monophosphate kinase
MDGMLARGSEFGASLIGGDTSSSGKGLIISVTLMGEQAPDLVVPRSGAHPGDLVCVTGTLGDSALGLRLLKSGIRDGTLVNSHLDPLPRVREGIMLAEKRLASAMIDISDGLLADLGHILDRSGTGARIFPESLPLSGDYLSRHQIAGEDIFSLPLSGGEDYELLFTAPVQRLADVRSSMEEIGTRCTVIGEITAGNGIALVTSEGAEYPPAESGFNHFPDR